MNCDEHVLQTLSANEKKKYGHMIIDFAVRTQKLHAKAICFSRNNTRFLKKRIRKIASGTQKHKLLAPVLLTVLCLTAGIPVAAYSPYTIDWRNETEFLVEDDFTADWIEYSDDPTASDFPADEQTFSIADAYILTDEGEIIVLQTSSAVRAACKQHTYKSGTLKRHYPNKKGCTVKTYKVIYCSKCRYIKEQTLKSTDSHVPALTDFYFHNKTPARYGRGIKKYYRIFLGTARLRSFRSCFDLCILMSQTDIRNPLRYLPDSVKFNTSDKYTARWQALPSPSL